MSALSVIRDRLTPSAAESARSRSESPPSASAHSGGHGDALPFDGYDGLDAKQAARVLSDHSQLELEAVESYERSHQDREPVLDKLRWLRGREPLPGYDALSVEQIVAALTEADRATITKVRGYERKFANRPGVLEEIARLRRRRRGSGGRP